MDVSTIIDTSRRQTATPIGQIDNDKYLELLNTVYKDLFSKLSVASKKYTRQSYTTDVVADQTEYILPAHSSDQTGIKLLLDVFYKGEKINIFDSNRKYSDDLHNDITPYGVVRDGSIFIYPTPKDNVSGGLRIEGKYIPLDLELTDDETNIKLPVEYHNILIKGLNSAVFGEKQIYDKHQLREQYYLTAVQNMIVEGGSENEDGYVDMEDPFGYYTSLNFMP